MKVIMSTFDSRPQVPYVIFHTLLVFGHPLLYFIILYDMMQNVYLFWKLIESA